MRLPPRAFVQRIAARPFVLATERRTPLRRSSAFAARLHLACDPPDTAVRRPAWPEARDVPCNPPNAAGVGRGGKGVRVARRKEHRALPRRRDRACAPSA